MTRSSLRRAQRRLYAFLLVVLAISLVAKLSEHMPLVGVLGWSKGLEKIYEYIKDMSLLIATGGVAMISNVYQKRSNFIESLEEEWRRIVATKSALYAYCENPYPTTPDYIAAFCRISETIDSMRIVYRNVGETDDLVGLYPFTPLHDMRRALMTLDTRGENEIPPEHRKLVRDAILSSFYALRENFLEELDLATPEHPILIAGARRLKRPGHEAAAEHLQDAQRRHQNQTIADRSEAERFLVKLRKDEKRSEDERARQRNNRGSGER